MCTLNHIHIVFSVCFQTKTVAKCKIAPKSVCILEHDNGSSGTVQYLDGTKVFWLFLHGPTWFEMLCAKTSHISRMNADKHTLSGARKVCTLNGWLDRPNPTFIMHIWSDEIDENCSEWNASGRIVLRALSIWAKHEDEQSHHTHLPYMDSDRNITWNVCWSHPMKIDAWIAPKATHIPMHISTGKKTYFNDVIWWVGKLMVAA